MFLLTLLAILRCCYTCNEVRLYSRYIISSPNWSTPFSGIPECPEHIAITCRKDRIGYFRFVEFSKSLDTDDDGRVSFVEGLLHSDPLSIQDLKCNGRDFRLLLAPDRGAESIDHLWERWIESDGGLV